jgi:hypothetical protein
MNTEPEHIPGKRGRKALGEKKRPSCTFNISRDVLQQIERIARESDKSRSDVINSILAHYTRFNP